MNNAQTELISEILIPPGEKPLNDAIAKILQAPQERLWRARSYEDCDTTYYILETSYEIDLLKPLYHQMQEYRRFFYIKKSLRSYFEGLFCVYYVNPKLMKFLPTNMGN